MLDARLLTAVALLVATALVALDSLLTEATVLVVLELVRRLLDDDDSCPPSPRVSLS